MASSLLAGIHAVDGDDPSAEARESRLNALLRNLPDASALHAELGTVLARRGDWPEASLAFRAAVENDRSNPAYRLALAACLEQLRRLPEAQHQYRQALELLDDMPDPGEIAEAGARPPVSEGRGHKS